MLITNLLCLNLLLAVVSAEFGTIMDELSLNEFRKQLAMIDTAWWIPRTAPHVALPNP